MIRSLKKIKTAIQPPEATATRVRLFLSFLTIPVFLLAALLPATGATPDSLTTPVPVVMEPVPVVVEADTLFYVYASQGGITAAQRAEKARDIITQTGKQWNFGSDDSLHVVAGIYLTDIMWGDEVLFRITDHDAEIAGISRPELAELYSTPISAKIEALRKTYSVTERAKRIGFFVLLVAVQVGLILLTNYAFRKLKRKIIRLKQKRLKPIVFRDYELLNTQRESIILIFLSKVLKWLVILLQLLFSVPMMFAIFPQTKSIAITLFSYVFEPVKMILRAIVGFIPDLFIIIVIYLFTRYLIKALRYLAREMESGKLKINGFYADWAQPTFNIVRFFLYAFMVAMIYQYLPGSQSDVFKGISVMLGLVVSLGSTAVIGNIIAGFVITYMRPFKVGDRIKLNDTEGHVIEKTPFVTRLRTPKNEIVTIPNSFIMSSHTTNYSASARTYGLIIHIDVGCGYEVPWQQVHQLLMKAALQTPGVNQQPQPFVLETALADSYPIYQINAYVTNVDSLAKIYSDLNQRIHDAFQEAGLELLLPHYYAQRDGNPVAMPPEYISKAKEPKK